jgi:hypothetical protein
VRLGLVLAEALADSPGWLADEGKLRRIRALAVGEAERLAAERRLAPWRTRPWPIAYLGKGPRFSLLQYQLDSLDALKTKLAQFPRGSRFAWRAADPHTGALDSDELFRELSAFLKHLGMELKAKS